MDLVRNTLEKIKYAGFVKKFAKFPPDVDEDFKQIYNQCQPYTMTSMERMLSLYDAIQYVVKNNIKGDFVECGVWKGGSSMLSALTFLKMNNINRSLFLYDTFSGMSEPTDKDINIINKPAKQKYQELLKSDHNDWCYATIDCVKQNIMSTGYPEGKVVLVKGKVEDTIPQTIPDNISILRLDTDWYESTYHELVHLFPRLSHGGILIIDDYGHWKGAKLATDQYFNEIGQNIFLSRIDYTGRIGIKQD